MWLSSVKCGDSNSTLATIFIKRKISDNEAGKILVDMQELPPAVRVVKTASAVAAMAKKTAKETRSAFLLRFVLEFVFSVFV